MMGGRSSGAFLAAAPVLRGTGSGARVEPEAVLPELRWRAPRPVATLPHRQAGSSSSTRTGAVLGLPVALVAPVAARRLRRRARRGIRAVGRKAPTAVAATALQDSSPPSKGYFPPKSTPLLDSLGDEGTRGMKSMTVEQLKDLAEEVRWQVLDAVSVSGGHLGAGLGVVELTVALHAVYDTPSDELCWDVAHQCQPHKVLTGRRSRIYTLRQGGGLSGFAKRKESPYDAFGAGHSSTSISAAVGFQTARERLGKTGHSVAIIGDGAITGGMAWEAMNHAGGMKSKIVVVLNDNGQVSLPTFYNQVEQPVGALSETLAGTSESEPTGLRIQDNIARFETSEAFQSARSFAKAASKSLLPGQLSSAAAKLDEYTRDFVKTVPFRGSGAGSKGELFEQLGFYYVGPIDGHNMDTLVEVLSNIKRQHEEGTLQKPVFLHIKTQKGKGYAPAVKASDKLHAVKPKFNVPKKPTPPGEETPKPKPTPPPLTKVFAEALVKEAERDEKIVAITAAMPGGTGIGIFEKRFGPKRTYDVGIAEQHAVTFAAGLAAGGVKPFCAIYSTFLQRGYDQLVHDVALQNLPVRFILDRAGLVGADGATHGGTFDLSFMACIPNMLICASADEVELVNMIHTLAMIDDAPTALRYPRGNGYGDLELPSEPRFLEPGKGRIAREGRDNTLAIVSIGSRLRECLKAAEQLEELGVSATVADARWVKPLDTKMLSWLASDHKALITVEENAIGGFSAMVQQTLLEGGFLDGVNKAPVVLRSMVLPDRWIDHDDQHLMYDDAQLNASHIVAKALEVLARVGVKMSA
uniref:1-deoxy-D-xylulose-5-phosphate synthase n=1 Tax=Alexandrium andersonii TaxID=327968 RepID=A0A7S2AIG5_9DINO